ncbi:hypothetical protein ABH941_000095 [Streptacidiphilus sp. EB103A]
MARQLVVDGWEVYEDDPKTDAGARTIALDTDTVAVLRAHRDRQRADRKEWGTAWVETGRIFTRADGSWLHPNLVSDRFCQLFEEIGLPPVRLHDLRHGAASIAHAAGADMHAIKEMLGHSSITITSDTYTTLLPQVDRSIAEAAARLVPRAGKPTSVPPEDAPSAPAPAAVAPSAHASLTQTAPDEESEAVDQPVGRPKLQVIQGGVVSRLRDSNPRPTHYETIGLRDARFRLVLCRAVFLIRACADGSAMTPCATSSKGVRPHSGRTWPQLRVNRATRTPLSGSYDCLPAALEPIVAPAAPPALDGTRPRTEP